MSHAIIVTNEAYKYTYFNALGAACPNLFVGFTVVIINFSWMEHTISILRKGSCIFSLLVQGDHGGRAPGSLCSRLIDR